MVTRYIHDDGLLLLRATRRRNKDSKAVVEGGLAHQILQSNVHAVTPIVMRVRRYVDALRMWVGVAQVFVYREPVLPSEHREKRGRFKVALNDFCAEVCRSHRRAIFAVSEFCVEEATGERSIFFPPSAKRRHIVCRNRAYGAVRILPNVSKFARGVFRHALNLEAHDLELIHHPRHAVGHHT